MATAGDAELEEKNVALPPKKPRRSVIRSLSWKRSKKGKMDENDDPQIDDRDFANEGEEGSEFGETSQSTKKRKRFGVWKAMKRMFSRKSSKGSKSFTEGDAASPKSHPRRSLSDPNLIGSSYRPDVAPLEQVEETPMLNEEPSTSMTNKFASHGSLISEMRSKVKVQGKEETTPIVHHEPEKLGWDVAPSPESMSFVPNLDASRDKIKIAPRQRRAPTRKEMSSVRQAKQAMKDTEILPRSKSVGTNNKHIVKSTTEADGVKEDSSAIKKETSLSEIKEEKMEVESTSGQNLKIEKPAAQKKDGITEAMNQHAVLGEKESKNDDGQDIMEIEKEAELRKDEDGDEKEEPPTTDFKDLIRSLSQPEDGVIIKGEKQNEGTFTIEQSLQEESKVSDKQPELSESHSNILHDKEDKLSSIVNVDPMLFDVVATTEKQQDGRKLMENNELAVPEQPQSTSVEAGVDISDKFTGPESNHGMSANISQTTNLPIEPKLPKSAEEKATVTVKPHLEISVKPKDESTDNLSPSQTTPKDYLPAVIVRGDLKQATVSQPSPTSESDDASNKRKSAPATSSVSASDQEPSITLPKVTSQLEAVPMASGGNKITQNKAPDNVFQTAMVVENRIKRDEGKSSDKISVNKTPEKEFQKPVMEENRIKKIDEKRFQEVIQKRPKSYHEGIQLSNESESEGVSVDDSNIGVTKLKQAFERTQRAQTISYSERRKKPEVLPKPRAGSAKSGANSISSDYSKSLGRNYRFPTTTSENSQSSTPKRTKEQIVASKNDSSVNETVKAEKPAVKTEKPAVKTKKPAVSNRPKPPPKPKMKKDVKVEDKQFPVIPKNTEVVNGKANTTNGNNEVTSEVPLSSFWAGRQHMFSTNGPDEKSLSSPPSSPEKTKEAPKHAPLINLKTEYCAVCGSKVYQMEKFKVKDNIVHRSCIKCSVCKRLLSVGNFIMSKNKIYCKPHEPSMTILSI